MRRREFLGIAAATPLMAANGWPGFRGNGASILDDGRIPTEWAPGRNIAWTSELAGYGQSSPVIWEDKVLVTSVDGPEKEHLLIRCLDLQSGRGLWERSLAASERIKSSDMVSKGAPTPAADAGGFYVFFESGDLLAMDHSGEPLWSRALTREYGGFQGNHGIGNSLRPGSQSLYLAVTHAGPSYLLSIDRATGRNRWKTDLSSRVAWTTPAILRAGEQEILILSANGSVSAYDGGSGDLLWTVENVKGNTLASPTVAGDLVLIGSSERGSNLALRLGPGAGQAPEILWRATGATAYFNSPLALNGLVFLVNKVGVAFALDQETGNELWNTRVGECWASPLGAGGNVYFFTKSGKTEVYRAGRDPEQLASNETGAAGRLYGVAASGGALLLRFGSELVCIRSGRGK
ncbi:MAG: PQQ-binding-like beta-propeller repeat protein [Bryobacterales bacterium]|nr:PQQ-binding-like beta-propeller repeat protein [Bryobacterales bacterium]